MEQGDFRSGTLSGNGYQIIHSLPGRIRLRFQAIYQDAPLAIGLRDLLNAQDGVRLARTNPDCAAVVISFNPEAFDPLSWLDQLRLEDIKRPLPASNNAGRFTNPSAALSKATFAFEALLSPGLQLLLGLASLASTLGGAPASVARSILYAAVVPILNRALQTVLEDKRLGADALDGASCLFLIRAGSLLPAAVMTSLIGMGELMRDLVTRRCQTMISHQLALSHRSAWLISDNHRVRVPVLELRAGDRLVVYPGELITCDGTVESGVGTIIPASPETEFAPQSVSTGDCVSADTLLLEGKLYIRNEQGPKLKPADPVRAKEKKRWLQRTKLHRFALHHAYERVWPVLSMAALLFAVTKNIHRAVTIVCFDFITGIRIAIPTAVLASMFKAGRRGIVIRNATALERLAEIDTVIFARSGTLTAPVPEITEIFTCGSYSMEDLTRLASAVEQRYSHLGSFAIYNYAHLNSIPVPERTSSHVISGLGVSGDVEGKSILVGSTRLMELRDVSLAPAQDFLYQCTQRGDSRVCVAIDRELAGVISFKDPLRKEIKRVIRALGKIGISEIAMMTGGSKQAAEELARQAGIETIYARTLPADKAKIVQDYKLRGRKVAVVGYDTADSLALEQADIAITLGTGADVARHRADVVLTSKSMRSLVEGIQIARSGMALAKENLVLVSAPNWLGLFLAVTNQADFLSATLLNNGSVIIGAANGLRPLLDKGRSLR
jgi:Cu2+-exporting ATPase